MTRKQRRRGNKELFGTSFFDMITCGLGGGMLLLFVIAAMVGKGGQAAFNVIIDDDAKGYYTLIAEFSSSDVTVNNANDCVSTATTWICSGHHQLDDEVNLIFSATDSESISCQLTLISALKVTHKPEQGSPLNCFKNGSYQVTLEKTDKVGFDWQE